MLSQDSRNLTKSVQELQHKAEQMADILGCIKINLQSLTDSLVSIEQNKIIHQPTERREYEDFDEIA